MTHPETKKRSSRFAFQAKLLILCVFGTLALSLLLRVTLGDAGNWLRWNLYIPILMIGPVAIISALILPGGWKPKLGGFAYTVLLFAISLNLEQPRLLKTSPVKAGEANLTVMVYNVMAYARGLEGIKEDIVAADPDLLILVEGTFEGIKPDLLARSLPSLNHWAVGDRLSIASRYPLTKSEPLREGNLAMMASTLTWDDVEIRVLAVDMNPPFRRDDARDFARLETYVQLEEAGNLLVAGDFNTPRGSFRLGRSMRGFEDGYSMAGNPRWLGTFPAEFPIWQLDHAFLKGTLSVSDAEILPTKASDHRPLLFGLSKN